MKLSIVLNFIAAIIGAYFWYQTGSSMSAFVCGMNTAVFGLLMGDYLSNL